MKRINFKKVINSSSAKQRFMITALIAVIITSMSVGYALYHEELSAEGNLIVDGFNKFVIYDAEEESKNNVSDNRITYSESEITDGVKLSSETTFTINSDGSSSTRTYLVYEYQFANLTNSSYTFTDFDYDSSVGTVNYAPIISGLSIGDVIAPGEIRYVTVEHYLPAGVAYNGDVTLGADFIFGVGNLVVTEGSLQVAVTEKELTMEDDIVSTDASIMNLYKTSVEYELVSSNSNVLLVNSSGNADNYAKLLNTNQTVSHKVYFKLKDGFDIGDGVNTDLIAVTEDGEEFSFGTIKIVPKEEEIVYGDLELSYTISPNPSLPDTYDVTFKVTNMRATTAPRYTFYVYLNESVDITKITNPSASIVYDGVNRILKVSSNMRGTVFSQSIPSLGNNTYGTIQITMNQPDLIIDKIELIEKTEIFTAGYDYVAN